MEPTVLAGRCILLVEDEPLISLDITARLQDAGARVVSASRLEKALGLAECPDLAAGVLDFDLGQWIARPSAGSWSTAGYRSSFIAGACIARSGSGPVRL